MGMQQSREPMCYVPTALGRGKGRPPRGPAFDLGSVGLLDGELVDHPGGEVRGTVLGTADRDEAEHGVVTGLEARHRGHRAAGRGEGGADELRLAHGLLLGELEQLIPARLDAVRLAHEHHLVLLDVAGVREGERDVDGGRSESPTAEIQSLMRNTYDVFSWKKQ